jgi:hypothetical protein
VSFSSFFLGAADVPTLALPLVGSLAAVLRTSSVHQTAVFKLNALVLGPGKLGLHQGEISGGSCNKGET